MSTRTVDINDTLEERASDAIEAVSDLLIEYLKDNPDTDELPCLSNDLDYSGSVHEIIDGSVPIYTSEIEDTWYLYGSELEAAYEDSGIGDNPLENSGMVAIYCYIYEKVNEWWWDKAEDIFQDWLEDKENEE